MTEETIFATALAKDDPAERAAYLDEACGDDRGLRQRVEALLRTHAKVGSFLERPAVEQLATTPPTAAAQPRASGETVLGFLQPSTKPSSLGRLAHYEALEVLGQGACGTVLKAFDEKLHRLVAIKVMAPHLAVTSPPRKRFLREARSAAAVRHENVITIHAVEEQPIPYLVMEYIAGETLQQKLDRVGPLDTAEVLDIGRQIAGGLAAAHAQGLVHRDIKPSNILLEDGVKPRVKITDFGLARAADDASLTQSGVIAGTPLYMAPEQARGEPIDHRADLFSLGSVLYVLCSGRPPFRAANALAVLKRVAEDTPRPLREINSDIPSWLCAVVERLHANAPDDRFSSAHELAELLANYMADWQQRGAAVEHNFPERTNAMAASPAKIQIPCRCGAVLAVAADRAGTRVVCPKCRQPVTVPAATATNWYLARGKQKLGPYSAAQLKRMAAAGQIHPTDMLLREGQKQWVEAATVKGLFPAPAAPAAKSEPPRLKRRRALWLVLGAVAVVAFLTCMGGALFLGLKLLPFSPQEKPSPQVRSTEEKQQGASTAEDTAKPAKETERGNPPVAGAEKRLDLKYLPTDASAALIVHPRQLLQSPLVAKALPAGAAEEMAQALGVQPEQVEQLVVVLQSAASGGPTAAPPPKKDSWTELDSKAGRFTVRFPVKPTASERKTTLGTRQVFTAQEGNRTFELSYVDFPPDSPFVGEPSRVDFATRALEFKPGFKGKKDIKLGNHLGAEVVVDDTQLKTYAVHRVFVVGDRLFQLEATAQNAQTPPTELARFFESFQVTGAPAPPPGPPLPAASPPAPGIVLRFAQPVDGKRILTGLLKGLREEKHEGKTYYRSSTGEALLGLPQAGALPDERTVLVAPEPVLWKMLAADGTANSPLLDRLRQTDAADEVSGILLIEPHRNLLKAIAGQYKNLLPPELAGVAKLPDRLAAVTAAVNLRDKPLLTVSLEADKEESVAALDALAFKGLTLARQMYPDFRPPLAGLIPAGMARDALAIADQLYGGVQVAREGKRLILRLERPEGLGTPLPKDLIASAGFNDAKGLNSNPVPRSPYPLDVPNREAGAGEPGWAGPWPAHADAVAQTKEVFEGDGALYLKGRPNFGPNYGRQLAQAQTGRFQIEYRIQVPAGSSCGGYVWQDPWQGGKGGPFHSGPNWGAGGGKFTAQGQDTGFTCEPGRWYKVTLRIDVAAQSWEFFVDDQPYKSPKPLPFRTKVAYLDVINFLVEGGVYIDDLRVTRLPQRGDD